MTTLRYWGNVFLGKYQYEVTQNIDMHTPRNEFLLPVRLYIILSLPFLMLFVNS